MTYNAGGPLARRQASQGRGRSGRGKWWVVAAVAVVVLLVLAGNGGRSWWARWLGDLTNGSRAADYIIGLAVGMLPLIAVAVVGLSHGRRRALRMFVAGAAGFIATDLLAPSLATAIRHNGGTATRPFETHVPGYLAGVYTGIGLWLVLLVVAVVRARRALHRRRDGYGR
jgi:hypothetical protein